MLQLTKCVETDHAMVDATLSLPYELRQKSRVRVTLDNGLDAGVMLPRGSTLKHGDVLQSEDGVLVGVFAAVEEVSAVRCTNLLLFAKACYHLGNRHVPLQIGEASLRYKRDHVLDDMLRGLGLTVIHELSAFEPEYGAYHKHERHEHA